MILPARMESCGWFLRALKPIVVINVDGVSDP